MSIPRSRSPTSSSDAVIARDTIRFVGSQRGPEVTAVPEAGYAIDLLPGRGFDRARTFQRSARNLRTAWDTVVALARAMGIVRRTRPAVVVGVGGYASLPTLVAGRLHRIPAVIHEADAHPGLANRIAVRLGARPAVSLPDTPLRGRGGHRQPDPARDHQRRAGATGAADRRGRRWKSRCATNQYRHARALQPLAAPRRRRDPPRDGCPRLRRVPATPRVVARDRGHARLPAHPLRGPHGHALRERHASWCADRAA